MSTTPLTAGCLAISLAATGYSLWQWWKAPGHKPKDLAPFAGSYVLGGLSTICGGVLALAFGMTLGLGNGLGKHVVSGTAGGQPAVMNHGSAGQLTTGGRIVTFLIAVGFVIAWKAAAKAVRKTLWWGWFSGATMTVTVGMAALFAHVVIFANNVGDAGYGWFNGGSA